MYRHRGYSGAAGGFRTLTPRVGAHVLSRLLRREPLNKLVNMIGATANVTSKYEPKAISKQPDNEGEAISTPHHHVLKVSKLLIGELDVNHQRDCQP